jgi:phosphoribosylglycinamide formyltransferase 1
MRSLIVVLASGNGSNLQAIIDACASEQLRANVIAVVSDRPQAFALQRATSANIIAIALPPLQGEARSDYDLRLAATVTECAPDIIVLAGWMRLLSNAFLQGCSARVINLHPALPGELPGTRAIERAFLERDTVGRTRTGVMVHYVPDEGVDNGPVISFAEVEIFTTDTLETLSARVHAMEHRVLIDGLISALQPRVKTSES